MGGGIGAIFSSGEGAKRFALLSVFLVVFVLVVVAIVLIVKRAIKRSVANEVVRKTASAVPSGAAETVNGPKIIVTYRVSGGLLEDGKCGFLDLEREDGEKQTVKLNFNKKSPSPIVVPLMCAVYRISYRTKSNLTMAAEGVMKAINENNGAMGAMANSVYDAGIGEGTLDSVVLKIHEEFKLVLVCETDGINKNCEVVSCE